MKQPPGFRIVVEDLGVAAPVQRGFELALDFIGAEVLVENVAEEFFPDGVIALGMQRVLDQPQDGDVLQRRLAEDLLLRLNVGLSKRAALGRDLDVAFAQHARNRASPPRRRWAAGRRRPWTARRPACRDRRGRRGRPAVPGTRRFLRDAHAAASGTWFARGLCPSPEAAAALPGPSASSSGLVSVL